MAYFPIFTDLTEKNILIYGGGKHALEKLQKLRPFGARCVVVARQILPEIQTWPDLEIQRRGFSPEDLDRNPAFVIAAQEQREENRRISLFFREHRIPVNAVDDPELCTFYFPALIAKGALSVGICTAGKSPSAAVLLREQIQALVPENIDAILEWSHNLRPMLCGRYPSFSVRRDATRLLVAEAFAQNRPLTPEETQALLNQ